MISFPSLYDSLSPLSLPVPSFGWTATPGIVDLDQLLYFFFLSFFLCGFRFQINNSYGKGKGNVNKYVHFLVELNMYIYKTKQIKNVNMEVVKRVNMDKRSAKL